MEPGGHRPRLTDVRAVLGLVLVFAAGCGGQHASTLGTSGSVPDVTALPSTPLVVTSRPAPVRAPTGQATAGTGYATVAGTTVAGTPPANSPAMTIGPSTGTVVVTDDASGSAVQLHVGQRLQVRLSQATYDPPISSAEQTLARRTSTGGYPSSQPVDALFEAMARGHADVTAGTDAACFHTEPRCMMPTRLWVVHVTVTYRPVP